jgi:hypothetical protein
MGLTPIMLEHLSRMDEYHVVTVFCRNVFRLHLFFFYLGFFVLFSAWANLPGCLSQPLFVFQKGGFSWVSKFGRHERMPECSPVFFHPAMTGLFSETYFFPQCGQSKLSRRVSSYSWIHELQIEQGYILQLRNTVSNFCTNLFDEHASRNCKNGIFFLSRLHSLHRQSLFRDGAYQHQEVLLGSWMFVRACRGLKLIRRIDKISCCPRRPDRAVFTAPAFSALPLCSNSQYFPPRFFCCLLFGGISEITNSWSAFCGLLRFPRLSVWMCRGPMESYRAI